jgi:hypothetical protein
LRFSLKRLLAGVTLVAVGLIIVVALADYEFGVPPTALLPFRRVRLGMALGFLVMLLILATAYYQVA